MSSQLNEIKIIERNNPTSPELSPYQAQYDTLNKIKEGVMDTINAMLYSSEYTKIIKLLNSHYPEFFTHNKELEIFLLKLQFFHFILTDSHKDIIINFYDENMLHLLKETNNFSICQNNLENIMFNPEIIKSRYYQQKWEESVNTLLTACRKSIIDYLYMQYNLLNPYHTCSNNWEMFDFQDCNQCVDDQYFNSSLNKLYNIEQELWINYFSYKSSAQSLSKSFDKYMYENSCVSFFDEGLKPNEMVNEGYLLDHLSNDATNLDIPYIDDYQVLSNPSNINTTTINEETFISSTQSKLKFQVKKENNRTNIATVKPEVKKVKLPFLKDFVIKFTKRENIDKAILRKFRKYIKEKSKKKLINFDEESSVFWKYFVFENLFPPMKYIENNEVIEFKSFNTTYMMWLLSHKGSSDLYEIFLKENYQPLYQYFIKKFNIMLPEEKDQVSFYLCNLVKIFTSIDSIEETNNVETECVPIREDTKNMINPYLNHATSSMFENDFDMLNEAFNINMGVEVSPPVYGKNNLPKIYHNSFENSEDLGSMFNNSYHGEKNNLYGDD